MIEFKVFAGWINLEVHRTDDTTTRGCEKLAETEMGCREQDKHGHMPWLYKLLVCVNWLALSATGNLE